MLVDLSKKDLVSLVCGTEPSYKQMSNEVVDYFGNYSGSYGRWSWNKLRLNEYSEKELYNLYLFLKDDK